MKPLMASLALACASSACNTGGACDTGIELAITLTVLDAATALPLAEASATATVGNRGYFFEGQSDASGSLYLMAPSGTYTVTASRTGYSDWVRTNVVVRDAGDPCPGPITESLEARLEAAPD